jgi:HEAT repeat protein
MPMSARQTIQEILGLDERISELRDTFEQYPREDQEQVLIASYKAMHDKLGENDPLPFGLVRITEMLINYDSPAVSKLLGAGLGHPNPDVRLLSGDAILHMTEEGLERIMPAVEDVLSEGGLGAEEMPFLLTDVEDPQVPRVLERFLAQESADVVASAIEAIAEYGDPSSVAALEGLTDDSRLVSIDDSSDASEWTVGRLAEEAIEMISQDGN